MPRTKEENNAYMKEWAKKNPDKIKANKRKTYINNKEKINKRNKEWIEENREYKAKKDKEYQELNKEKIALNKKRYYEKNKEYLINQNTKNQKRRRKEDSIFKLKGNLRCRIKECLKANKFIKTKNTELILGTTMQKVKDHIESQFKDGMSWENYGSYWHIDHIIPLAKANTIEEVYELCHYKNLQPLWAEENLKKGSKILELVY